MRVSDVLKIAARQIRLSGAVRSARPREASTQQMYTKLYFHRSPAAGSSRPALLARPGLLRSDAAAVAAAAPSTAPLGGGVPGRVLVSIPQQCDGPAGTGSYAGDAGVLRRVCRERPEACPPGLPSSRASERKAGAQRGNVTT